VADVRVSIQCRWAFHISQDSLVSMEPVLLDFLKDVVISPESADFSFKVKRAVAQSGPTTRISFEFDGHLSFTHPAFPLKRSFANITLLN